MQCYTELVPPTGVTSAVSLPFTSSSANNLVVARTSVLQVFSLKPIAGGGQTKLVLVSEYHVAGTITALGRVKVLNSRSGGEAILIAVRDAKLSLVEWDPEIHGISTVSIHYYESEDLQKNPFAPHIGQCATHLTVDPSSRCAAFNFGVQNLAILPFHQHGDDLVMDEYDAELDGHNAETAKTGDGDLASYSTPYASSFVLSLTTLDPGILHPIDLAFLYEYREPTFGILYTNSSRSQSLSHERKDVTYYAVFTLDLEQKASTTLLSISKLPNDLYRLVPLPPPVGGALLIGSNELVHVDQGGKTNAIAVNEFARQCSAFAMADNSGFNLRLEGSHVVSLGPSNSDLLLVLATGHFILVTFKLDGRTVSGVQLEPLNQSEPLFLAAASCATFVHHGLAFIGSEEADSVLLGFTKSSGQLRRQSSRAAFNTSAATTSNGVDAPVEEDGTEDEDDLDEDLYGPEAGEHTQRLKSVDTNASQSLVFNVQDSVLNIGPIRDAAFGLLPTPPSDHTEVDAISDQTNLELVVTSGGGNAGGVSVLQRQVEIETQTSTKLDGAIGVWSVGVRDRSISENTEDDHKADAFLIVSIADPFGAEHSNLYRITSGGIKLMDDTEFESSAGGTISVGSIADGTRVVQVLQGELRSYDSAFALSQIYPIVDEDTGAMAGVISASFADPYVLIVREDSTICLLQADKSGDLEECEIADGMSEAKWLSGCLYNDRDGHFGNGTLLFLLGSDGSLHIIPTTDLAHAVFQDSGLKFLPTRLNANPLPKHWRQQATLTEILVTELGDETSTKPYMLLRTSTDELVIYEPYRIESTLEGRQSHLTFLKSPNHLVAKSPAEAADEASEADTVLRVKPLTPVRGPNGLRLVIMPGASPSVIAKTSVSSPQVYHLRMGPLKALTAYDTEYCPSGFAFVNQTGQLHTASFNKTAAVGLLPWVVSKKCLGSEVSNLSFFPRTGTYVLASTQRVGFQLPQDDEWHPEWQEEQTTMSPLMERSSLKLLSRKTWNVIDTWQFDEHERVMCMKTLNLETSDETHERKDLVVVGTAITRGEDVSARGSIYIFDVADVVPEPGIEETDLKLKLIAKEDVKGSVTALSQVGSQGFVMAAQGQKCMVRGLKEDCTILPVAFLDMNYYVSVIKELKGTGLCILGDACHGLWFTGYSVSA